MGVNFFAGTRFCANFYGGEAEAYRFGDERLGGLPGAGVAGVVGGGAVGGVVDEDAVTLDLDTADRGFHVWDAHEL